MLYSEKQLKIFEMNVIVYMYIFSWKFLKLKTSKEVIDLYKTSY